jgi:hypothetical protein
MNPIRPEFIRLPTDDAGGSCPFTGLKRGVMRNLTIPCKANGFKPVVPAKSLRAPGNLRGIWIVPYAQLIAYLHGLPTAGLSKCGAPALKEATPAQVKPVQPP